MTFDAITSNGGVVNQIIGDGLMAVFGPPRALDEHAAPAVRAACEMVDVIAMFSEAREAAGLAGIRIGVGIATGEVIAGYTGTSRRAIYTCIDDAANLASRLESHTKDARRSIVLDGTTRQGLGDEFRLEPLGSVPVRGKANPVEVHTITGY